MSRVSWSCLALLLLVPTQGGAGAAGPPQQNEPMAVIRRAIQAAGGTNLLTRKLAAWSRCRFTYQAPAELAMAAESFIQVGGRPCRFVYRANPGSGVPEHTVVVINGKKSWRSQDGIVADMADSERTNLQPAFQTEQIASLIPLLADKRFQLATIDGGQVDGRPARAVRVSAKDMPEVDLFFDKASGLLVKYISRYKQNNRDVVWQMSLRSHRDLTSAHEEKVFAEAGLAGDDHGLLDVLRKRIPDPAKAALADKLLGRLGDDSFTVREQAELDLVALGPLALPALRKALVDQDLEVRRRAKRSIWRIERMAGDAVASAAVSHLARRRAPAAVEVLLAVLPSADSALASDVRAALATLALSRGYPDPILLAALADKDPIRRSAATAALGLDGRAYLDRPGRKLFLPGPLTPTTIVNSVDNITRTLEMAEIVYYNRLDDALFEKP